MYIQVLNITSSILFTREIGEKDPQDLTIDSSGTKNYSLFITEVSQALPKQVKPSVTTLLPHLNGEVNT